MQTLIMTAFLIAISIVVYRQHIGLKRLYKISQGQREVNRHLNKSIQALSKDALELRGTLNRRTGHSAPMPELPAFIQQPQTRYIGGEPHVN